MELSEPSRPRQEMVVLELLLDEECFEVLPVSLYRCLGEMAWLSVVEVSQRWWNLSNGEAGRRHFLKRRK